MDAGRRGLINFSDWWLLRWRWGAESLWARSLYTPLYSYTPKDSFATALVIRHESWMSTKDVDIPTCQQIYTASCTNQTRKVFSFKFCQLDVFLLASLVNIWKVWFGELISSCHPFTSYPSICYKVRARRESREQSDLLPNPRGLFFSDHVP